MWPPDWLIGHIVLTQAVLNPPNVRRVDSPAVRIGERAALASLGKAAPRKPRLRRHNGFWHCGTGWSAGGIGRDPKDAFSSWRLANTPGISLGYAL